MDWLSWDLSGGFCKKILVGWADDRIYQIKQTATSLMIY